MPVGVVVERRKIDHPWAEWSWKPTAVVADPPQIESWRVLSAEGATVRWLAGTATVTFHRKLVEAYLVNLAGEAPMLWVVMRQEDERKGDIPYFIHAVTASPYEAQDFLDSAEDIVEAVPMPHEILSRLIDFLKAHPQEEVAFTKRKRDRVDLEELKFSKQPIFARTDRTAD